MTFDVRRLVYLLVSATALPLVASWAVKYIRDVLIAGWYDLQGQRAEWALDYEAGRVENPPPSTSYLVQFWLQSLWPYIVIVVVMLFMVWVLYRVLLGSIIPTLWAVYVIRRRRVKLGRVWGVGFDIMAPGLGVLGYIAAWMRTWRFGTIDSDGVGYLIGRRTVRIESAIRVSHAGGHEITMAREYWSPESGHLVAVGPSDPHAIMGESSLDEADVRRIIVDQQQTQRGRVVAAVDASPAVHRAQAMRGSEAPDITSKPWERGGDADGVDDGQ